MKKTILIFFNLFMMLSLFSSEISEMLRDAQIAYESGNLSRSIQIIDSVKSKIEKEQMANSSNNYLEIPNWAIVKLRKSDYLGKKVKVEGYFYRITSDGKELGIWFLNDTTLTYNTFDSSVIDKLITLKEYEIYTFYGTIKKDSDDSPILHVESIK